MKVFLREKGEDSLETHTMQPLLNGSIISTSLFQPHKNGNRFYSVGSSVMAHFSNNRKKIFLFLCAFIMGTWIGTSLPNYNLIPQACSTVQTQTTLSQYELEFIRRNTNVTKPYLTTVHNTSNETESNVFEVPSTTSSSSLISVPSNLTQIPPETTLNPLYIVDTPSCRIPHFDPYDSSVRGAISKVEPLYCAKQPPLTYVKDAILYVNQSNLKYYGLEDATDLSCCFSTVTRTENGKTDNGYLISKNCTPFETAVHLTDEFVTVSCVSNEADQKYTDFHCTVPKKPKVRNKVSTQFMENDTFQNETESKPFSVMLIGLDAVSRLNFERHLIQTRKFLLKKLNAIEMMGYNKVGDNTFPNLVALLTGYSREELTKNCWKGKGSSLDNCTFIWSKFSELGYRTLYGEDCVSISTFNYLKEGFYKQPTDYYLRPFFVASENTIGWSKNLNTKLCLGPRPIHEVSLGWARDFMNVMATEPYFGILWSNSLTHDDANYVQRADPFLINMLTELTDRHSLNDTILIFLSDHGIRWGPLRNTRIGRYEERLPTLLISLPPRFHRLFPEAARNLRSNSRRVTSTFDLHKTLLSILALASGSSTVQNVSLLSLNGDPIIEARGISLFDEVPLDRSCEEAGVNAHWCACDETIALSIDSAKAFALARFVVSKVNDTIQPYKKQCATLKLDTILGLLRKSSVEMHEKIKHDYYYTVTLSVVPSGAVFEATVREDDKKKFILEGEISRLNLYGNQSACISNLSLKIFCFCIG